MSAASVDPREQQRLALPDAAATAALSRDSDPTLAAMARDSHRLTLARLANEVLDAVDDGDSGVPEASRLHIWVRVELLPWAQEEQLAIVDESERAAVRSDFGVIVGLNSLLAGANHEDAAAWTRQLHRTALIMLARLDYLAQG